MVRVLQEVPSTAYRLFARSLLKCNTNKGWHPASHRASGKLQLIHRDLARGPGAVPLVGFSRKSRRSHEASYCLEFGSHHGAAGSYAFGDDAGSWYVDPMLQYHDTKNDPELKDNFGYQAGVGFNLPHEWAVEGDFSRRKKNIRHQGDGRGAATHRLLDRRHKEVFPRRDREALDGSALRSCRRRRARRPGQCAGLRLAYVSHVARGGRGRLAHGRHRQPGGPDSYNCDAGEVPHGVCQPLDVR